MMGDAIAWRLPEWLVPTASLERYMQLLLPLRCWMMICLLLAHPDSSIPAGGSGPVITVAL